MSNMLEELPFNHFVDDDDFYSSISYLSSNNVSINYEKLNNLIFNVFETNIENDTKLPNNAYDPDINCQMYRSIANDMSNVCDYYTEDNFVKAAKQFNPSDLSMFHFNVRSLPAHIDEFSPF